MKAAGAIGAASILPISRPAAAAETSTIDDSLDTTSDTLQEVLVVFDTNPDVDRLRHLDLSTGYHKFEVLPIGYTELTGDQIETIANWPNVRYVQQNAELEYHNDDSRENTRAGAVHTELDYTGESVHSVVIDTGIDGDHPDLTKNLVANWRYVNPLTNTDSTVWKEAGNLDTDDNGHGTHASGSVAADGTQSDGEFGGMAPDADLTVYSAGLTLFLVKAVAAFDHLIARKQTGDTDVQLVSNSYGTPSGADFNPDDALNIASWEAFNANILPLFSAGNSGSDTNTLNDYAKAPHVLGVAATSDDKTVTDFSSRGRSPDYDGETNYDRRKALDNLDAYHAADRTETEVDSGSYAGRVGPNESEFHEWDAPSKAEHIEATLSWDPSAEDIDFYLREGDENGEVVASGATLNEPEELSGAIESGETYYFEIRPFANVAADYTIEFTAYEGIDRNTDPMGIYRNGVGANGNLVMSTLAPEDPLQGYEADPEVWYGRISGTSMSCPVTAGVTTLVIDAYRQNGHGTPDSIDVLNTVETEAEDNHEGYTPANIGAGFINAFDAVQRAIDDDLGTFGTVKLVDE